MSNERRIQIATEQGRIDGEWTDPFWVRDYIPEPEPEPEPQPEPDPVPPPPPPSTADVPWVIPTPTLYTRPPTVKVNLPTSVGPDPELPSIDPRDAGVATLAGDGLWRMTRGWNAAAEGASLGFGEGRLDLNGAEVSGFTLKATTGGHGVLWGGVATDFTIDCKGSGVLNVIKGNDNTVVRRFEVLDYVGDALKVGGEGDLMVSDGYITTDPTAPPTGKHIDGLQAFRRCKVSAQRIVIDWRHMGSVQGTTAPLFLHDHDGAGPDAFIRDWLILNPGGTWGTVRISTSGDVDIDRVQIIGDRKGNVKQPSNLAPRQLVWGVRFPNLFNDVPGAADYR